LGVKVETRESACESDGAHSGVVDVGERACGLRGSMTGEAESRGKDEKGGREGGERGGGCWSSGSMRLHIELNSWLGGRRRVRNEPERSREPRRDR
jgi:hypothetical protein